MTIQPFTLELLFKIPKQPEKPPVVAVIFPTANTACELNADLIENHIEQKLSIRFKKTNSHSINFDLVTDTGQQRFYTDVKYDPIKLENFLYVTRDSKTFLFIHLLKDFDRYFAVHTPTHYKRFEMKIEKIYLTEGLAKVK